MLFTLISEAIAAIAIFFSGAVITLPVDDSVLDPNAPLGQLKRIDDGVFHLGKDGVMRSYHGNGTCAGYVKLDASQIQRFLDHNGRTDELTKIFEGVNGHDVTDQEQLMKPANWLASLSKRDAEDTVQVIEVRAEDAKPKPGNPLDLPLPYNPNQAAASYQYCSERGCINDYQCTKMHCGPCVLFPGNTAAYSGNHCT